MTRADPAAPPAARRRRVAPLAVAVLLVVVAAAVGVAIALTMTGGGSGRPAELDALHRLESILAVAGQGRGLIGLGDYNGAIANRRAVLRLVDGLGPVPTDLRPSVRALRAAEAASLAADTSLRRCGAGCSQALNDAATRLKRRFTLLYNPLAGRNGRLTFGPEQI